MSQRRVTSVSSKVFDLENRKAKVTLEPFAVTLP